MRGVNLQTVKARVERLAASCLDTEGPITTICHWQMAQTCAACGFDLLAYAIADARTKAHADGRLFGWANAPAECPQCAAVSRHGDDPNHRAAERSGAADAH
jgi:hypothetical protein